MTTNDGQLRLGGVAEVAAELKVSRQQVAKLRQRDDFPPPVVSLTAGDVWDLNVIRRWAGSGLRRTAGRPPLNAQRRAVGRRFELGAEIGDGGFATVYSAQDLNAPDGTRVAVKTLQETHTLDPDTVARFKRELRLMSELSNPYVMPVLASGTDHEFGLWYAMPLARGSLADELGRDMEPGKIAAVMREICAGLAYIHGNGILHRDLKPENVLRTQAGTWAIADFGLARAVAEDSVRLTATAEAMGTAFYMAPEQRKDAKRVTVRADVYSVGKIMQALVTGGTPLDDDVPPGKLRAVIRRVISQDPLRRHGSAAELLDAIETAVAVVPVGRWETQEDKAKRLRPRLVHLADEAALDELVRWADEVDAADEDQMRWFAETLSALSAESVEWWWDRDPGGFSRAFQAFAERLKGDSFPFGRCDTLADFARRAVVVTGDAIILQEAVCGLTCLGYNHNRWHVRDVAVAILQNIQADEDAGAAFEGLRMAGKDAAGWTIGDTVIRTLRPTLRGGVINFFEAAEE